MGLAAQISASPLPGSHPRRVQAGPAGCQPAFLDNSATTLGGLTAEYYAGNIQNAANDAARVAFVNQLPGLRRNDATVNYPTNNWGAIVPPAAGTTADADQYSARFRGSVYLTAGDYTFQLVADDAAYLWLGAATALTPSPLVSNALIAQPNYAGLAPQRANFTADSTGLYDLQLLFGEGGGGNYLTLSYAPGPEPDHRLRHCAQLGAVRGAGQQRQRAGRGGRDQPGGGQPKRGHHAGAQHFGAPMPMATAPSRFITSWPCPRRDKARCGWRG